MFYSLKEKQWIVKMYEVGYTWNDISKKHKKTKFPVRTKWALQKFVSRYVNGKA